MNLDQLENEVFFKTEGNFLINSEDQKKIILIYKPGTIEEKTYTGKNKESVYRKMLKDFK